MDINNPNPVLLAFIAFSTFILVIFFYAMLPIILDKKQKKKK